VGFYLLEGETLYLGPFQGKPACVSISVGKGVCGTAVATRQTLVVDNVHQFPGHIACDAESRSEIVIPMIKDDRVIGVLDIDSPVTSRFDHRDKSNLEEIVSILIRSIK
jgi:GAF domain-containing protein